MLATHVCRQILSGRSITLADGSNIRVSEFDVSRLGNVANNGRPDIIRDVIDNVTETQNREAMLVRAQAGGALVFAVQSAANNTLLDTVFDTLGTAAKKQVTGTRPAIFLVGFHGLNGEQLLSVAGQDIDPTQQPTALRLAVSKFLLGPNRDHVVGVGFLSQSAFHHEDGGLVDSGGITYFFPRRDSSIWHDDFGDLF